MSYQRHGLEGRRSFGTLTNHNGDDIDRKIDGNVDQVTTRVGDDRRGFRVDRRIWFERMDGKERDEENDDDDDRHTVVTVDLDVSHRTVAVSADHFLSVDYRRLRGDALQPVLRYRPTRTLSANSPYDQEDHRDDRQDRQDTKTQVQRWQS